MDDDLVQLNRRIAHYWLGILDADQEDYLHYTLVCLGELKHSGAELAAIAGREKLKRHNCLSVAMLNREYLRFARLAAKDVAGGKFDMLVRMGITLEQAEVLGNLTNKALARLAFGWNGPIIRFDSPPFIRGAALHVHAARYHAAALVAISLSTETGEGS